MERLSMAAFAATLIWSCAGEVPLPTPEDEQTSASLDAGEGEGVAPSVDTTKTQLMPVALVASNETAELPHKKRQLANLDELRREAKLATSHPLSFEEEPGEEIATPPKDEPPVGDEEPADDEGTAESNTPCSQQVLAIVGDWLCTKLDDAEEKLGTVASGDYNGACELTLTGEGFAYVQEGAFVPIEGMPYKYCFTSPQKDDAEECLTLDGTKTTLRLERKSPQGSVLKSMRVDCTRPPQT